MSSAFELVGQENNQSNVISDVKGKKNLWEKAKSAVGLFRRTEAEKAEGKGRLAKISNAFKAVATYVGNLGGALKDSVESLESNDKLGDEAKTEKITKHTKNFIQRTNENLKARDDLKDGVKEIGNAGKAVYRSFEKFTVGTLKGIWHHKKKVGAVAAGYVAYESGVLSAGASMAAANAGALAVGGAALAAGYAAKKVADGINGIAKEFGIDVKRIMKAKATSGDYRKGRRAVKDMGETIFSRAKKMNIATDYANMLAERGFVETDKEYNAILNKFDAGVVVIETTPDNMKAAKEHGAKIADPAVSSVGELYIDSKVIIPVKKNETNESEAFLGMTSAKMMVDFAAKKIEFSNEEGKVLKQYGLSTLEIENKKLVAEKGTELNEQAKRAYAASMYLGQTFEEYINNVANARDNADGLTLFALLAKAVGIETMEQAIFKSDVAGIQRELRDKGTTLEEVAEKFADESKHFELFQTLVRQN